MRKWSKCEDVSKQAKAFIYAVKIQNDCFTKIIIGLDKYHPNRYSMDIQPLFNQIYHQPYAESFDPQGFDTWGGIHKTC